MKSLADLSRIITASLGDEHSFQFVLLNSLDCNYLDNSDYSIIRTFFLVPIFSSILISCDLEDSKPNNPFERLLEQHITLCAFQNLQMQWGEEIFCCIQLISDWLNYFVAKKILCLINSFRVDYVNTRAIKHKLKSKTCLQSKCELFYQLRWMINFAMRSSYNSLKQTNMFEHFRHCKNKTAVTRKGYGRSMWHAALRKTHFG